MRNHLIKSLFLKPLAERKSELVVLVIALLFLGVAQSIFLLAVGPFLKSLLNFGSATVLVTGAQLLPKNLVDIVPQLGEWQIEKARLVVLVPAVIGLSGLLKNIATYFYQTSSASLSLYVSKGYRDLLFANILRQPYAKITELSSAEWMSRLMNDVLYLQTRFSDILNSFLRDGIVIISAALTLFFIHWPTAVILVVVAPIVASKMGKTGKKITFFAEAFQRELALIANCLLEIRKRFDFMRCQHGEAYEIKAFAEFNERYYRIIRRSILVRSAFAPALEFFGFAFFAVILILTNSGFFVFTGENILVFFATLGVLLRPLKHMGEQIVRYQETKGSLSKGLSVFEKAMSLAPGHALTPPVSALPSHLRWDRLVCGVDGKSIVQTNGLELHHGAAIAIIGPSGSGKSTLLKTFAGLFSPVEWKANAQWADLVTTTSLVSQEPFLFDGSVRDNLSYGQADSKISEPALLQTLDLVNMRREVAHFPDGLDSSLDAISSNISGGQRQRLVIARALLRQRPILLLDEATSALDSANENAVMHSLLAGCRKQNVTLLAVTHRLSQLSAFDEVWFVEDGAIVAKGRHEDLIRQERYREFHVAAQ